MFPTTVAVNNLSRQYETQTGIFRRQHQSIPALKNISLAVQEGEIFGLIGPNGAGKTTLIKILTTLLAPSSGYATVLGFDVATQAQQIRPQINFIFGGERGLYWRLSAYDNLSYFADLYYIDRKIARARIEQLLKMVELWERRHERVEGFSKGMKQRLHIAKALINDPKVLFLDEPTIGLDPVAARNLRTLISEIRTTGVTIFLTSHYMLEMEALCDRIAVLKDGAIVKLDTPVGLKDLLVGVEVVEVQLPDADLVAAAIGRRAEVVSTSLANSSHLQTLTIYSRNARATMHFLQNEGYALDTTRLLHRAPSLEDAYIKLVGGVE
ncbi:MAG: ABC transporter ATP-binding protein [Caldilineaceae bacterium]